MQEENDSNEEKGEWKGEQKKSMGEKDCPEKRKRMRRERKEKTVNKTWRAEGSGCWESKLNVAQHEMTCVAARWDTIKLPGTETRFCVKPL